MPSSSTASASSAPVRIDRVLTRAILRGAYRPGTRLPTLRELADEHDVNPATMQRALARLEARGLITARQGSGLRVNDPKLIGDASLLPDLLAASADDPESAATILEDLLEVRRVMAVRLIVRHRRAVLDALADLAASATQGQGASIEGMWRIDMDFARGILAATGNRVAMAILNSVARALEEIPVLVQAMYEEPARNASSMLEVLGAIHDSGDDLAARLEQVLARVDRHTVTSFRRLLEREATGAGRSR
jgi:GntR family transcriptional regulator, transcriptional repressor for pyruvate dehydrogenase complex